LGGSERSLLSPAVYANQATHIADCPPVKVALIAPIPALFCASRQRRSMIADVRSLLLRDMQHRWRFGLRFVKAARVTSVPHPPKSRVAQLPGAA